MKPHFHGHQENLRTAALSIFLFNTQNTFSRTFVENSRTFQGYANFQGLFKDMMLFQGPLRTRASHAFLFHHSLLNTIIIWLVTRISP